MDEIFRTHKRTHTHIDNMLQTVKKLCFKRVSVKSCTFFFYLIVKQNVIRYLPAQSTAAVQKYVMDLSGELRLVLGPACLPDTIT